MNLKVLYFLWIGSSRRYYKRFQEFQTKQISKCEEKHRSPDNSTKGFTNLCSWISKGQKWISKGGGRQKQQQNFEEE